MKSTTDIPPRILAFAGSTRSDSFNRKLIRCAAQEAQAAGVEVTVVELSDYPMPLFNEDLKSNEGPPKTVLQLQQLFLDHQGLLLACPEYNSSITPLLKNVIDWVSRPTDRAGGLEAYQGKVAGLLSASPGGLGGLRGLNHVRSILSSIGAVVIPKQHAVSQAHEAFDKEGNLSRQQDAEGVRKVAEQCARLTQACSGSA